MNNWSNLRKGLNCRWPEGLIDSGMTCTFPEFTGSAFQFAYLCMSFTGLGCGFPVGGCNCVNKDEHQLFVIFVNFWQLYFLEVV